LARAKNNAATRKTGRTRRRGAAIVEAAIVLPLFLILLLALCDFARLVMTRQLLDNAARSGARLAVTNTATLATTDIQNCVTTALGGQSLNNMTIQVYQVNPSTGANLGAWNSTPLGSYIAVEIDGNFQPICPGISQLASSTPWVTKVIMLCEAN
jgi:Flp pilus assembly protein TadG